MERSVEKMSEVELWFEYRTLREAGEWNERFKLIEKEIIKRVEQNKESILAWEVKFES